MISLLLLCSCALYIIVRITKWIRNYLQARSYGLPIILLPVSFNEPLWMLLRPLFAWVQHLPFNLGTWYLYTSMGWPTEDNSRTVLLHGETFILCSPVDITIATCEPTLVNKIWGDTRDIWRMPASQSQLFAFFGQNVSSTHGDDWKRHRRVTVQAFSERTMGAVWRESRRRAGALRTQFESGSVRSLGGVRALFDALAMQVLTVVAFGQEKEVLSVPAGHTQSLMESMGFLLKHVLLTVVFHSLSAPNYVLPGVLRRLKVSIAEVEMYMEELVLAHMQSSRGVKPDSVSRPESLLEAMVAANEVERSASASGKSRSFLTDSELYGNIFVYNLGGYETTASTLTFALPFLAAHPEMQNWVAEELASPWQDRDQDDGEAETRTKWHYNDAYPRLLRTRALMYETLRLASPAPLFVKTPLVPMDIEISTSTGRRNVTVQPGMLVGMNQYGAHLSPRWGTDSLEFNPKRFITVDHEGRERFQVPDNALFAAWMVGPRTCPAKKFSQVEFAGIVAEVLSEWRVEVVGKAGESEEEARERVKRVLRDEKYFHISAHLKRPEAACVRFVPRS